jgi:2-polyprenyl-3-methyl-5-hydroxy-6-metoxy-1,4-benzoquinol methylase
VTGGSDDSLHQRLYQSYATQHAGLDNGEASTLIYRRDIHPFLPSTGTGPVLDIGCGQGALVQLLLADGYDAAGVDRSAEQVALAHAAGISQVHQGDYREFLAAHPRGLAAITATDVLEHLTKEEVLQTLDQVAAALCPGGAFVARVPNAVSPFGGNIRYGDFTHQSWFTERSVRQICAAARFESVAVVPCPPVAHGLASAARVAVWKSASALCKLVLAAETGVLRGHIVTQNLTFAAWAAS